MAQIPYVVYGTVSDADGTAIVGYPITLENTSKKSKLSATTTDSNGRYIADLANMDSDYATGDLVTVYVRYGGYTGEGTFTVTVGGTNQDVTVYGGIDITTLRTDIWDGIYHTLQTGTYAVSTDNIHQSMNQQQISEEGYPQVIIYTPVIDTNSLDFNTKLMEKKINIMIEIYHKHAESLKVLTDEIEQKLWDAEEVWSGLFLFNLDMPDNDYDWWDENKKTIHRATLNANFTFMGRR